jgi:hypothetical protein
VRSTCNRGGLPSHAGVRPCTGLPQRQTIVFCPRCSQERRSSAFAACVRADVLPSLRHPAYPAGGCQCLGRMVINVHLPARTGSVVRRSGSVTREQFSPRCSAEYSPRCEAIARAVNTEPWERPPGMEKRQCLDCRCFFASLPDAEDPHYPDCASEGRHPARAA